MEVKDSVLHGVPSDSYIFEHGEEYPNGYFWEMIGEFFEQHGGRKPREVKFMRDGHYGLGSMPALIQRIDEEPNLWTVTGYPTSFQILPLRDLTRPL